MKYCFYVSGNASRLKVFLKKNFEIENISFVLIDNIKNQELNDLCKQFDIPFYQYSYLELGLVGKKQNQFISTKLLELIETTKSDYCFIFGGRILEGELLAKYQNKLINFHPSLLPAFKGKNAIDQALENNAILLGNTAHFINDQLDDGISIMQSFIPAHEFNGYDSVMDMQVPMLIQLIKWLKDDRILIDKNKVIIKNAQYKIDSYIPNLET